MQKDVKTQGKNLWEMDKGEIFNGRRQPGIGVGCLDGSQRGGQVDNFEAAMT